MMENQKSEEMKEQKFLWKMVDVNYEHEFARGGVFIYLLQRCQENRSDPITADSSRARCSKS